MNCPRCPGELAAWIDGPVTHHYCPACQPGYTEPPSKLETMAALLFMVGGILLYPLAWLYLKWRGEI